MAQAPCFELGADAAHAIHRERVQPEQRQGNQARRDRDAGEERADIAPRFAFAFCFSLSYTTFGFSLLRLSSARIAAGSGLAVSVRVTNTGEREGAEVVQVYVRDLASSLPRPPEELKGFARVALAAGASGEVTIPLPPSAFEFYDPARSAGCSSPGDFEILVAASAADVRLRATVTVGGRSAKYEPSIED